MSASNNVGKLIQYGGVPVYFAAVQVTAGRVSERVQFVLEELIANGVDGRRWRKRFAQYMPFTMQTVSDGATWLAGQTDANAYEDLVGQYADMTLTFVSTTKTWKNVKILGARPQLSAGKLVGANADPASSYVLTCEWNLVLTQAAT